MNKVSSLRSAYAETLIELGKKHENLIVLDADLAMSTKTVLFKNTFPERFFDMGISEADMMGTAAGLASSGKIVFASTFALFASGRAWEQVRSAICYPKLSVKIVATHGGISVGPDGVSHQAAEDIAIMRAVPNIRIIVPSDATQTRFFIHEAYKTPGPFYIRLTRPALPVIYEDRYNFNPLSANKLKDGEDGAIIACGIMVFPSLKAAEKLQKEGIGIKVFDMSCIKPVDRKAVVEAAKTGHVVTCEDHSTIGGLGDAVGDVILSEHPCYISKVGLSDRFAESGSWNKLKEKYGLTEERIYKEMKNLLIKVRQKT
ncbi:transketolase family protein [candidate division WOR-3 bacterium]|nr:transketolase family protein [candidate division WOR-3 bacterium]